jgi:hypothetical protein
VLLAGPPFTVGYALNALLRAKARTPALLGFALAVSELLALGALMVIGVFQAKGG